MNKIMIVMLLVLAGCAYSGAPKPVDPCKEAGGVWYKGPLDRDYRCVDRQSLQDSVSAIYGVRA